MKFWLIIGFAQLLGCGGCGDLGEPVHQHCGNDAVDPREVCDGDALGGESCASQGFDSGPLRCAAGCGGFIYAGCEGVRNPPEPCSFCAEWEECQQGECVSVCDGEPFVADTELSLEYATVQVSGVVSAGDSPSVSGELIFAGEVWWDPLRVQIGADGGFEAKVQPGVYRVTFAPSDDSLSNERLPDLDIDSDTAFVIELTPWTDLKTPVRFAGEQPSDSGYPGDHGHLVIEPIDPRFGLTTAEFDDQGYASPLHLRDGEVHVWWAREVDEAEVIEYLETTSLADLREREFIDIPLVWASVGVEWNGGRLASINDVRLEIVRADEIPRPSWNSRNHDRERWTLNQEGRASGWLLERARDVALVANGPPWWGWLWAGRDVSVIGDVEVQVTAPRIAGEVRRNDRRLPNSALEGVTRGRMEFVSDDGFVAIELSDRGRGEFEVELPRGDWSLQLSGNLWSGALPVVPYQYPQSITVTESKDDLELDVPAVRLAGQLTINGERPPDEPMLQTRGSLEVRRTGDPTWFTIPIPPVGPAGWDVVVAPGEYEAELTRWVFATLGEEPPDGELPLGRWAAGRFDISESTRRDVDVRIVEVEVSVTRDGGPAPDGLIWFEDLRTARVARELPTAEDPVTSSLYPGHYRVLWAEVDESREPLHAIVLDRNWEVSGATSREFDASQVRVSGELLVDGEVVSDVGEVWMTFARQPNANSSKPAQMVNTGRATFEVETVRGLYNIILSPPAADHSVLVSHGVVLHRACAEERLD